MNAASFRYDGKRVLVVGGATGMGAATARIAAELGAHVIVMDVATCTTKVDQEIKVDLRDKAAVETAAKAVSGPIDAIFCCAGVADGTPGIMLINFIAQRHLVEILLANGVLGRSSSITWISSVAGLGWNNNLAQVLEFLAEPGWEPAAKWIAGHEGTDGYSFSKQAINGWVAHEAFGLLTKGIRTNAILPGPTDTPLARANADTWLTFAQAYREQSGAKTLQPEEMATTLLFLGSAAASGVSGVNMLVDQGHVSSAITGSYDEPAIKYIMGG